MSLKVILYVKIGFSRISFILKIWSYSNFIWITCFESSGAYFPLAPRLHTALAAGAKAFSATRGVSKIFLSEANSIFFREGRAWQTYFYLGQDCTQRAVNIFLSLGNTRGGGGNLIMTKERLILASAPIPQKELFSSGAAVILHISNIIRGRNILFRISSEAYLEGAYSPLIWFGWQK